MATTPGIVSTGITAGSDRVGAGLCVGIPAGVFAVYRRYRGYFT